jgi:myo-inositol catabolism protein IolC
VALGYDGKLYILAFDHRGSFQKKWFGLEGDPSPEDTERIADAKRVIYEGLEKALEKGAEPSVTGALVDEQFGEPSGIPTAAREHGLKLAMPVEKSGQNEFDFEYGDDFGTQLGRLKTLSDWLHANDRKFLFELLVPAEDSQLEQVGGDTDRYDAELRPQLMRRAIEDIQNAGIEVDIWKIEGVDERSDAEMLAKQSRSGEGREGVVCVLLGRGANDDKVDHWLTQAAPVEGFVGFAIGRSIWGDALKGFIDGSLDRDTAAGQIAENYLRFVRVYEDAEQLATAR